LKGEYNVKLRPLREEDLPKCISMMLSSEPWITLRTKEEDARKSLVKGMREGKALVAEIGGKIAGFIVFYVTGAFPLGGYIGLLGVFPNFRGRGIGKILLKTAEKEIFKSSINVFLLVSSFNRVAITFYEKNGYQRVGEIPDAIVAGHSEIIMRKTLGPLR